MAEPNGAVDTSPSLPRPSYLALLGNRSFSSLWLGQLVSQSGDAVFDLALLWVVLATTGSTVMVGFIQAAVLLPAVFAGPIAGVYADRVNRRNLMVISCAAQGAVTAGVSIMYATGSLDFLLLVALVLMLYTGAQFYAAANSAIIPRIVSRENLGAANSLFSLTTSANQLVGYSVGGVLLFAVGPSIPITYDSLTFFFAVAMLLLVAKTYGQTSAPVGSPVEGPRASKQGFWSDFRAGQSYVRQSKIFIQIISFGVVVNGFAAAIATLLPAYVKFRLGGDSSTYGFLLATMLLGMVLGSVVIGKVNFRAQVGKLLFSGVFAFGGLLAIAGAVDSASVALCTFFLMGVLVAAVNIPISTLVQTQIPGELLGRASTVLRAFLTISQPLAAVLAGSLTLLFSVGDVFIYSGLGMLSGAFVLYLLFGELRAARY
jgi:MFS family permease